MSTATPEDGNIAEDQDQQQGEVGDIKNKHPGIHRQVSRKRDMSRFVIETAIVAVIIGIFKSVVIKYLVAPGKFCFLVVFKVRSSVINQRTFMLPWLTNYSASRVFLSSNIVLATIPFFS